MTTPSSERQPDPGRYAAWNWHALVAESRRRGLPRRPGDRRASLIARLTQNDRETAPAPKSLTVSLALNGPAAAIDVLSPAIARLAGARLSATVALLSADQLPVLRRIARRLGIAIPDTERQSLAFQPADNTAAMLWAAAHFVSRLGESLAWPSGSIPPYLKLIPAPASPKLHRQGRALLRLWTASLDATLAPDGVDIVGSSSPPAGANATRWRALAEQAIAAGRCLRLEYAGRTRAVITRRTVEPHTLERVRGIDYLRAHCQWRQAERLFRLDRIVAAELLPQHFTGDDGPELRPPSMA